MKFRVLFFLIISALLFQTSCTKDEAMGEDTDRDGVPNEQDTDDDNDGVLDIEDAFPLDKKESKDTDKDGKGDFLDTDDDNDGVLDLQDAFPLDKNESLDTDGDGIGNNVDTDDDGDGVLDTEDGFPLDKTKSEIVDTDNDGVADINDTDDDNDGVLDTEDAFPLDKNESIDTDGDGVGNNADTDDDGDGVLDVNDEFPLDASESKDSDGDGIGDNQEKLNLAGCTDILYEEKNGIVKAEMESAKDLKNWTVTDINNFTQVTTKFKSDADLSGFSGEGYIYNSNQGQHFGNPGVNTITYKIKITNTGRYRFQWKAVIINNIDGNSEHNDSWLRFNDADDFYGYSPNQDPLTIYPRGNKNGSTPFPKGSSANGWMKVYFKTVTAWQYGGVTNDGPGYGIYVEFDQPGIYTMEVSMRSTYNGLDQFILMKDGVNQSSAKSDTTEVSNIICGD